MAKKRLSLNQYISIMNDKIGENSEYYKNKKNMFGCKISKSQPRQVALHISTD